MEKTKEEEFQLIGRILGGDRNGYRLLVDRYAPVVFSIVRRFSDKDSEIEELAQQIFVKAYENLDSFNKKSRFSTWLYRLAKNHCLDYAKNIRRLNMSFSEIEDDRLDFMLQEEESPEMRLMNEEWNELLYEALHEINPDNAEAFLYKYRDEMTYEAMSNRLDVGVSALKVRVHRARKELKAFMDQRLNDYKHV